MYAKVRAGAAGYDIIVPSSYMVKLMHQQGLLMNLDTSKLSNLANTDPAVLAKIDDQKMEHSVPYATSFGVLAYRKDKVKNPQPTWAMLARTDLNRRVCVLNDMRETIGAALKSLGFSINTHDETQLAAARDVVIGWKQHIAKFDNEQYKSAIDSGEFVLVHGYSGDLFQVVNDNDKVGILFPREGATMGCDELVIPKSAPNAKLAHEFINFTLDADVAAENMQFLGNVCPNVPALKKVSPEFLKNPVVDVPADVRAKCEVIQDLGDDLAKYTKVWDEVKAAK
jgi:spermidine/putrescine transport system substrate-binding protein